MRRDLWVFPFSNVIFFSLKEKIGTYTIYQKYLPVVQIIDFLSFLCSPRKKLLLVEPEAMDETRWKGRKGGAN